MELYFIGTEDGLYIKIGVSGSLRARCAPLQTGSMFKLQIVKTIRGATEGIRHIEKDLHEKFRSSRMKGEWFRWDRDIDAFLYGIDRAETVCFSVAVRQGRPA